MTLPVDDRKRLAPQLSTSFSYAMLAGGLATMAAALYLMRVCYSSLPWGDSWDYLAAFAHGANPLSAGWLWRQHNEHRQVLQKIFFAIDLKAFRGRQAFLLASIAIILLLSLGVWAWAMRRLGGWRGPLWRTGIGLAAFCIFSLCPWLNYVMGFQVCYVLSPLFATLSFTLLLLYWRESGRSSSTKFLWLSILAALAGNYSISNGNFLWPLLLLAAVYLRLRPWACLSIALTGAVSTSLYFFRYVRPPQSADPVASLHHPVALLKFVAVYFGSSWVEHPFSLSAIFGLFGLLLGLAVLLRVPYYLRMSRPFPLLLILMGLFCLATAVSTAAGRVNLGIGYALADRYQTFALLYWCCLGLLLLDHLSSPTTQKGFLLLQVFLIAVMLRGAILAGRPMQQARAFSFSVKVTSIALRTIFHPSDATAPAGFSNQSLVAGLAYLRQNRLSLFSDWDSGSLGMPLEKVLPLASSGECTGRLAFARAQDHATPDVFVEGWAWDRKHQRPPDEIVVTTEGAITGLAAMGLSQPGVERAHPEITSAYAGFAGYARELQPGDAVKVFAVINDAPISACYLDEKLPRSAGLAWDAAEAKP